MKDLTLEVILKFVDAMLDIEDIEDDKFIVADLLRAFHTVKLNPEGYRTKLDLDEKTFHNLVELFSWGLVDKTFEVEQQQIINTNLQARKVIITKLKAVELEEPAVKELSR